MVKTINLEEDNLSFQETKSILTENKAPQTLIHGEVTITNQFGSVLQKKKNIILLGGRRFTLEKLFNVELPKNRRVTLNELFSINQEGPELSGLGPKQGKCVCLFGVGRGGSGLTFGSKNIPAEKEYNLYDMIPMRYVDANNDLTAEEKSKYYLRVPTEDGKFIAYYLKKFELDPELVVEIGGEEYYPNKAEDNLPTDWDELIERKDVDMSIQLRLKVSVDDVREYFIETDQGIEAARVNELATYLGYKPEGKEGWVDYLDIEAFSKLTFNNEPLDDETKELNIVYKFFI